MSNEGVSTVVREALEQNHLDYKRWKEALTEGVVLGLRCESCDFVTATPKAGCVRCGSHALTVVELPETGTVYTKTTVEVAPDRHGSGYQIALVELDNARILGRIADGDRVEIGDEVQLQSTYEYAGDTAAVFGSVDS